MSKATELAIDVANLSFAHRKDVEQSLVNLALKLPTGSRTLLIGANGGASHFPRLKLKNTL